MIDYISGKLVTLTPTMAVIDNQGIGYASEISLQTYDALNGKSEATLYMQSQINPRDGITVDYGFATTAERELFRQITSVSGMGAASARMVLSSLSPDELRNAILSEDVNRLKGVKGIGLKTAQRMVLELKDKVIKGGGAASEELFGGARNERVEEATQALIMLGFNKQAVGKAIQTVLKANPNAKVEQLIKSSLQIL